MFFFLCQNECWIFIFNLFLGEMCMLYIFTLIFFLLFVLWEFSYTHIFVTFFNWRKYATLKGFWHTKIILKNISTLAQAISFLHINFSSTDLCIITYIYICFFIYYPIYIFPMYFQNQKILAKWLCCISCFFSFPRRLLTFEQSKCSIPSGIVARDVVILSYFLL